VLIPDDDNYGLHGLIYGNTRVLWRTAQLLARAEGRVVFPEGYRAWIERVYQEERWDSEPEAVSESYRKFWEESEAARMVARRIVNEKVGELSDTDAHVATLTRDGEMNLNLLPVLEGPRLLDGRLLKSLGDDEKDEALNLDTVSVPSAWRGWLKELLLEDGLICWRWPRPGMAGKRFWSAAASATAGSWDCACTSKAYCPDYLQMTGDTLRSHRCATRKGCQPLAGGRAPAIPPER
jgi:hypothetical protein